MFHLSGKIDQLLKPDAYYEAAWFERELAAIFRPGWNFLCLASEVAQSGDRFAGMIAGPPDASWDRSRLNLFGAIGSDWFVRWHSVLQNALGTLAMRRGI